MTLRDRPLFAVIFAGSFVCFCVTFFVAWAVSAYVFRRVWPRFLVAEKADWASRVNSQIHAFIVVPGFLATLATTPYDYSTWYVADGANLTPSTVIMAISLGYFSFDFFVLVYYRVPLWIVFVCHHIVAASPYFSYVFHPCPSGNLVLSCFLLVETATIFLNFQTWMEKLGYAKTHLFTLMFYGTYVSWFLTRLLLPVFLLYVVWNLWLSDVTVNRNLRVCLIPGFVCAHLITIFCWVVFFFVLTPDMLHRWKETPEALEERLESARRRRRQRAPSLSSEGSRSSTPSVVSGGAASSAASRRGQRASIDEDEHHAARRSDSGPHEPIELELAATPGRGSPAVERGHAAAEDDDEEVELGETEPQSRGGAGDTALDYELILQTMLHDNPYTVRPEGRPQLRSMSFDDLRREGISLESRTTAYATTTFRL